MTILQRHFPDWLQAYLEYNADFEHPSVFSLWVGISVLAASTSRQVWFPFGASKIWPNLFITFVGPSGCGKTQAMRKGRPLLDSLGIGISPDKTTGAKMLHKMSQAVVPAASTRDGMTKTPYMIYAEEFPSFLGDKAYASGLLADLTALWDCPEPAWIKTTMKDDYVAIPFPYICLLAGSTAQGLFDTLPHNTLGQGFTSRIIFVYSEYNPKRVPMPPYTDKHKEQFRMLQQDLAIIQQVVGPMMMTPAAEELWTDYYIKRVNPGDRFEDDRSQGFASREPVYVLKLGQVLSLSESNDRTIKMHHIQTAIDTLATVTEQLPLVYATMTPSPVIAGFSPIMKILEVAGRAVSHQELYRKMRFRLDPLQFKMAIEGLRQAGLLEVVYPEVEQGTTKPYYRKIT